MYENRSILPILLDKFGLVWIAIIEPILLIYIIAVSRFKIFSLPDISGIVLIDISVLLMLLILAIMSLRHFKYFIEWRLLFYSSVSFMYSVIALLLYRVIEIQPSIISLTIFTLFHKVNYIFVEITTLTGLLYYIKNTLGTRIVRGGIVFKEMIMVFVLFALSIISFLTVIVVFEGPSITTDLSRKAIALLYIIGINIALYYMYEFLRLIQRSHLRIYSALSVLITLFFLINSYTRMLEYIFEFNPAFQEFLSYVPAIVMLILIALLVIVYSGLDLITKIVYYSVRTPLVAKRNVVPMTYLIEFYREDPFLSVDMVRVIINRLIKVKGDLRSGVIITYFGSPFIEALEETVASSGLKPYVVYVIKGLGLPRYDERIGAYTSVFDGNHLRLLIETYVKEKPVVVIVDDLTHEIVLYGVERVYNTLSTLFTKLRRDDLVVMLFNPYAHDQRERAYIRNLAKRIISVGL